jgi:hypothetical protein
MPANDLDAKKRAKLCLRTTTRYKEKGDKVKVQKSLYRSVTGPKCYPLNLPRIIYLYSFLLEPESTPGP